MRRVQSRAALPEPLRRHPTPSITTKATMSFNNSVVWIDHTNAQVIHFDKDASESESLRTHSTHPHPHQRHGDTHANEDDNSRFYDDIAAALKDSAQVLIVGPAEEKTAFMSYLTAKVPAVAEKIKAVETVDHPSNGELLNHARKYFVSAGGVQ
jgi:stalled ribosome rescue protein Dom34